LFKLNGKNFKNILESFAICSRSKENNEELWTVFGEKCKNIIQFLMNCGIINKICYSYDEVEENNLNNKIEGFLIKWKKDENSFIENLKNNFPNLSDLWESGSNSKKELKTPLLI
jgi:hypothetical protein